MIQRLLILIISVFNLNTINSFQIQQKFYSLPVNLKGPATTTISRTNQNSLSHRTNFRKRLELTNNKNQRRPCSNLSMIPTSLWPTTPSQISSFLVAFTLLFSSTLGFISNQLRLFGGDAGTIVTLLTAAFVSNTVGIIGGVTAHNVLLPTSHPFYDLCWSRFLPASLAFILLSLVRTDTPCATKGEEGRSEIQVSEFKGVEVDTEVSEDFAENDNKQNSVDNSVGNCQESGSITQNIISAVSIPFVIGSIGSIVGCIISALVFCGSHNSYHQHSPALGSRLRQFACMNPIEASVAAGCLCASYIGGTVNFFATAQILKNLHIVRQDTSITSSLFTSMAAADVLLMAIYFGTMSGLMSWHRLKVWFPGRHNSAIDNTPYGKKENVTSVAQKDYINHDGRKHKPNHKSRDGEKLGVVSSGLFAASLAWFIVETSIVFEKYSSHLLPGMGSAAVAAMGTGASILLEKIPKMKKGNSHIWTKIQQFVLFVKRDLTKISLQMSEMCFHLLFAAIGSSASITAALCHGPIALAFAALALLIHMLFACFGTLWTTKAFIKSMRYKGANTILPLDVGEVLVASNAAIGGATTAAAFAGSIGGGVMGCGDDALAWANEKKRGLVIAATFWGVLGYACATTVGVSVANFLLLLLV